MGKGLSKLNRGIGVAYCWNYGPSKLLLPFIEYRLDQLNNHTIIAVNSTIHLFESRYQKKYLLKVWNFLIHPPQNDGAVNFFAKLDGSHLLMANIFKHQKYQTFGLLKMHNTSKIWFANNKFNLWKSLVYNLGCRKCYFLNFAFFILQNFK